MNNFLLLVLVTMVSTHALAAELALPKLLQIRPGSKLEKSIKPEASTKSYSYEIEKENDLIKSVSIELNPPVPSEQLVKNETKGHCLIQARPHVNIDRFFFFDMEKKRRYEFNNEKKIIGILIQDIPGARANPECTFGTFNPTADKK